MTTPSETLTKSRAPAGPARDPLYLSASQLSAFVGLRQCGRYLRLTLNDQEFKYHGSNGRITPAEIDRAFASAGRQVEDEVAAELRRRAPNAPFITRQSQNGCTLDQFVDLLAKAVDGAQAPCSQPVAQAVGCWAAEVSLSGKPAPDSIARVRGRADFILLLWLGNTPVLRIVECKASAEPQTTHLVQLVLYRLLLIRALGERSGAVRIGSRDRTVPRQAGVGSTPQPQVECVLHLKDSGSVVTAEPLAAQEVDHLTRQLIDMLRPGGRVETALSPSIPFSQVPYELDIHCRQCPRAPVCWADSAHKGALQLSGCSAAQAQRLAQAGLADIEDLAGVGVAPGAFADGGSGAGASRDLGGHATPGDRLRLLAAQSGIDPMELQRLAVTARVRAQRRLGTRQAASGSRAQRPQMGSTLVGPAFAPLPGAPPSCLPPHGWVQPGPRFEPLVRVFLSIAVDPLLRRIVGLAAHIAPQCSSGEPGSGAPLRRPPEDDQRGRDIVLLLEGVTVDATDGSTVLDSEQELNAKEARLLARFSAELCDALGESEAQDACLLHFYVHAKQQLQMLLQRCIALDPLVARGEGARAAGGGRSGVAGCGAGNGGGLAWLVHLLGQRADAGEQDMVSIMEEELRRYVTAWQGNGLLAATSVNWAGDGIFDWRLRDPAPRRPGDSEIPTLGRGAGVDLRAVFSAAGMYLDCLEDFNLQRHTEVTEHTGSSDGLQASCQPDAGAASSQKLHESQPNPNPAADSSVGQSASPSEQPRHRRRLVQVRPDAANASIPPSVFRALWAAAPQAWHQKEAQDGNQEALHETQRAHDPDAQQERKKKEQRGAQQEVRQEARNQDAQQERKQAELGRPNHEVQREAQQEAGQQPLQVVREAANCVRELLQTQAHALRWLEERLVRLPRGSSAAIRKVPLPTPLGRQLLSFRLGTDIMPGPFRQPRGGPQVASATEIARSAVDAVLVNRNAEIRQFWLELGRRPPAERAGDDRSGALVLDQLQVIFPQSQAVRGCVVYPKGCSTFADLCAATGLGEGDRLLMTLFDKGPWSCQDAEQTARSYALCELKSCEGRDVSGADAGRGSPADLWVECHVDWIRYPRDGAERLFLLGSPVGQRPAQFVRAIAAAVGGGNAERQGGQGSVVALDAAPNISAWVASSVIESLIDFGTDSAYLAERLRLPADLLTGECSDGHGVASRSGGAATPAGELEPHTPPARAKNRGEVEAATPDNVLAAQDVLSPAFSEMSISSPLSAVSPAFGDRLAGSGGVAAEALFLGKSNRSVSVSSQPATEPGRTTTPLHPDQGATVHAFLAHPGSGSRVLLQGPPGTGKTETVARAVLDWLAARLGDSGPTGPPEGGGVVLLSGPTHTAINTLMQRIAQRLQAAEGLRRRVELVRLKGTKDVLDPELKSLGVRGSVPSDKAWPTSTWLVVGGTLRHLVKDAKRLRTAVALRTKSHRDRELMESSGLGAFASALVVDEASMMLAPQLLALGSLLLARGSLLVAGDHRQLTTIVHHCFEDDLRPNFIRHRPFLSAFEYMRLLAGAERLQRQRGTEPQGTGYTADILAGGDPPPVAVCALTYTHRLPAVITRLISPLYRQDGIQLQGRAPAPSDRPDFTPSTRLSAATAGMKMTAAIRTPNAASTVAGTTSTHSAGPGSSLQGPLAPNKVSQSLCAHTHLLAEAVVLQAAPVSASAGRGPVGLTRKAPLPDGTTTTESRHCSGGLFSWQQVWAGREGLFLVIHNEEGSARNNALEVELVRRILDARRLGVLMDAGLQEGNLGGAGHARGSTGAGSSVAIVTPHRAQRRALRALVDEHKWDCRVETVERLQGSEADTVIFSATVSDGAALSHSADFYASLSRANVAFSRTRQRLIVVASRTFLNHMPSSFQHYYGLMLWRQLRSMCEKDECLMGEDYVQLEVSSHPQLAGRQLVQTPPSQTPPPLRSGVAPQVLQDSHGQHPSAKAEAWESCGPGCQPSPQLLLQQAEHAGEQAHDAPAVCSYRCDVFGTGAGA